MPNRTAARLATWALSEHARFAGQTETDDPLCARIGEYWSMLAQAGADQRYATWDGRTPDPDDPAERVAWSAAFIGAGVFEASDAAPWFPYDEWHSTYIRAAIRRAAKAGAQPFRAFHIDETGPREGDIVVQWRRGIGHGAADRPVTWETAPLVSPFTSHGDIVVAVERDAVRIIGGNLADQVQERRLALGRGGRITDRDQVRGHWFALIRVYG